MESVKLRLLLCKEDKGLFRYQSNHLARRSMKNGANSLMLCELQDHMNIDILNAYCRKELVSFSYLAQGRLKIHRILPFGKESHWAPAFCPLGISSLRVCCADFSTTQLLDLNSLGWPVQLPCMPRVTVWCIPTTTSLST